MKLQMVQMARLFPVDPILVLERIDAAAKAREVLPGARDVVTRPSPMNRRRALSPSPPAGAGLHTESTGPASTTPQRHRRDPKQPT